MTELDGAVVLRLRESANWLCKCFEVGLGMGAT